MSTTHVHHEIAPRARLRYKVAITLLAVGVLGIAAIAYSLYRPVGLASKISNEIGSILIVGGFLGWANETFSRRDMMEIIDQSYEEILHTIGLATDIKRLGMCTALSDCKDFDYAGLINTAEVLTVRLNDGRTWVSQYNVQLEQRLADKKKRTTFYIIHPQSPMVAVLAKLEGKSTNDIRYKIRDTLREIQKYTDGNEHIKVYGHFLFNAFSAFMTEDVAVITLYFASHGKKRVPLLAFDRGGSETFYHQLVADFRGLDADAVDITKADIKDKSWLGLD